MSNHEGGALDLEAIGDQVVRILVDSFDYPETEARQRVTLWRSQQHDLAGQALGAILSGMTREEREQALLKWAVEGLLLERDLMAGAEKLDIDLDQPT
jgi:hypothetical protein